MVLSANSDSSVCISKIAVLLSYAIEQSFIHPFFQILMLFETLKWVTWWKYLNNFTCCLVCITISFLHMFYFSPFHPAGAVWLKGSECCSMSYLCTESLVKFASFSIVKGPWKLLMLTYPSVRVWFIHLKLPELRWVKPWSCLLITVIMMQLKKRKQKEKKGLNVREIWVQLS